MEINTEELLDDVAVARLLRQRPQTIRAWRCHKKGPRYLKLGARVFYRKADIDAWLKSCIRDPEN